MALSDFQRQLILSAAPPGTQIKTAHYFQEEYLPCPVHVTVRQPNGALQDLVLRVTRRNEQGLQKEAILLPLLTQLGVSTPRVLVPPQRDPTATNAALAALYSFLPGQTLQQFSEQSAQDCQTAIHLLLAASAQLAAVTSSLRELLAAQSLTTLVPTMPLMQQWETMMAQGGPWLAEPSFRANMHNLRPRLEAISDPLVFTNGDYQPGNFLTDGKRVTGFVDFEYASFQDYLYGFAKYPIYDLHPLNKGGMIEQLLQTQAISFADFAPRLALACLWTLQREIPVDGGESNYRTHVLALLARALAEQ